MAWQVGDKVIFEFRENSKIEEVDGEHVTTVRSQDVFLTGGRDLETLIVEQTAENLVITKFYTEMYKRLHENCPHVNFPDIRWYFVQSWLQACNDGIVNFKKYIDDITDFVESTEKACRETEVRGVHLFRR